MLLIELALGTGLGVWLRYLYFEYVFDPYPTARLAFWGLLPPLAAGVLLALVLEGTLRLVSRKRRSRGWFDRGLGASLIASLVIQTEAAKIGAELHQPLLVLPVLPALVSMSLTWIWVVYRANTPAQGAPREDLSAPWALAQPRSSSGRAARRGARR